MFRYLLDLLFPSRKRARLAAAEAEYQRRKAIVAAWKRKEQEVLDSFHAQQVWDRILTEHEDITKGSDKG